MISFVTVANVQEAFPRLVHAHNLEQGSCWNRKKDDPQSIGAHLVIPWKMTRWRWGSGSCHRHLNKYKSQQSCNLLFSLRKTWETEKNMTCWSPFIRFEGCRHSGYLDQSTHEDWNSGIVPDKFLIEMHEATVPSNAKRFLCLHLVHHLFQIL